MPGTHRTGRALQLVSFAAFFTTLLIYSPNVAVLKTFDGAEITGDFAEPYLVCATVAGLFLAFAAWRKGSTCDEALLSRRAVAVFCLLYVLANAVFAAVSYCAPSYGAVLAFVCAVAAGLSVAPVCIAWSSLFDGLTLRSAVGGIALCFGISSCIGSVMAAASSTATLLMFLFLLVLGVFCPLRRSLSAPLACSDAVDAAGSQQLVPPERPSRGVRPFLSVMGVPLLGMAIASFAMGVQPTYLFNAAVDAQHIGMLLASLALAPLYLMAGKQPVYSFVYQVYLPVAAAVVLVLCVLPVSGVFYDIILAAVHAFYCMVIGVAVAASCAIANAREFSRTFVFATLVGTFCAFGISGIFLGGRIDVLFDNSAAVLIVLTAIYACGMFLSACVKSWRLVSAPLEQDVPGHSTGANDAPTDAKPEVETFDERLSRLAQAAGLSPRETEIAAYVGRGHSSVYVAKTLLISESTVYTHVRNIYRKLGISSREELIRLLNDPA